MKFSQFIRSFWNFTYWQTLKIGEKSLFWVFKEICYAQNMVIIIITFFYHIFVSANEIWECEFILLHFLCNKSVRKQQTIFILELAKTPAKLMSARFR